MNTGLVQRKNLMVLALSEKKWCSVASRAIFALMKLDHIDK